MNTQKNQKIPKVYSLVWYHCTWWTMFVWDNVRQIAVFSGTFSLISDIHDFREIMLESLKPVAESSQISVLSAVTRPSCFHVLCLDSISSEQHIICIASAIANYRRYLKIVYKTSTILSDKWPPTPSREYVTLSVVEGDYACRDEYIGEVLQSNVGEILCGRREISVEEILEGDGQSRLVLIEGAPGIGKSTFAWELCRKWEEFPCMQQYNLVVLLRLREEEVQKIGSVSQLFFSYESEDKDALVTEVLKDQGKGILFILDEFDELPKALQQKSYLVNLIKGRVLPASTVLVTSRPSATAELLTSCRPQKRVEILGFTQESVEAYARSIFSSDPKKLEKFMAYISISNNPAINSLMYVPLNAAIIVQIYQHSSDSSILPHTLTELYTQLCLTVLNRYLKANDNYSVNKFDDLSDSSRRHFLKLSALAFEGIEKEEVIFHNVSPDFVHFGFLDSVSALYGGGQVSYNFLHLTIQEFLAAYHVSQLRGDGLEVFEQYKWVISHWNVVFRFVAGLTKFEHFQGHLNLVNKEDTVKLDIRDIQCLFEAQDSTYFYSAPAPKYFEVTLDYWSPLDEYALGYCISNIATRMTWKVNFDGRELGLPHSIEYFTKPFMISNSPSVGVIEKLSLLCVQPQLCELKHLPLQEIRVLELSWCELTNTDLLHLSELITNMPSLVELDLSRNHFTPLQDDGLLKVLQQLSHSNVTTLNVDNTEFYWLFQSNSTHDYLSALTSLINPSSGRLQKLSTEDDDPKEIGDGTFESLLFPSSLRTVTSNYVDVKDNTCTLYVTPWLSPDLATKIVKHITYQRLILENGYAHNEKAQEQYHIMSAIADVLQENTTLQRVDFRNCSTQSLGLKIVKHNITLQHLFLDLSFYDDDDDAQEKDCYLNAIADALQENATLQRVGVRCSDDISQHRAFSLDRLLVWIDYSYDNNII